MQATTYGNFVFCGDRARSKAALWAAPVLGCLLAAASLSASAQIAFQAQPPFATGPNPSAIAVGDFNGDGKLDLAVAMYGNNDVYIYTGNGNGTFSYAGFRAVGVNPTAIVAVDLNHDGILDLATANLGSGNVSILIGNGTAGHGDGTFQTAVAYTVGSLPISIAVGSFNPNGFADLVTANQGNVCAPPFSPCGTLTVLGGNGDGTFFTATTLFPQFVPVQVATGVFDSSLNSDIVVTGHDSNAFLVYLGDGGGAGSFPIVKGPFATASAYAVMVADFNGGGKSDLAISRSDYGDVSLLLGNGDGTFQTGAVFSEGAIGAHPYAAALGDFDGDGFPDLALANNSDNSVAVLRDRTVGNGGFDAALTFTGGLACPSSIAVGDFNRDGKPDLVVANDCSGTANFLTVFLNTSIPTDRIFANGFE